MTLSELKDFLISKSGATLPVIAKYFSMPQSDMEVILNHWACMGRIRSVSCKSCSSCTGCPIASLRLYVWSSCRH